MIMVLLHGCLRAFGRIRMIILRLSRLHPELRAVEQSTMPVKIESAYLREN